LIINADDFGLTAGVNRAVIELHRAGFLSSSTLMAKAAASHEAIELAASHRSLGVGCHVVLVDGEPVLSAQRDIPNLADPVSGRLRSSLTDFVFWLYGKQAMHSWSTKYVTEIEAEAAAQISHLQSRGVLITHVDTHKHTHMLPAVLRSVLRAAKGAGIDAVRNPFEPAWSLRATRSAPFIRRMEVALLRRFEPSFRRIVAEEGLVTTDGAMGILATGTLDSEAIKSLLGAMPEGTFELVTHPGYMDGDLARAGTRLVKSREVERIALTVVREFPEIALISFGDLTGHKSKRPASSA